MPDVSPGRRAAADAAVFDDSGRILLQHRADFNAWGLPGGSVEVGETLEQAILREVKEETGYDVQVVRLIGAYSDPVCTTARYPNGNVAHYVSLTFECRVIGGSLQPNHESHGVAWFSPSALPADLLASHASRIADAFVRKPEAYIR